jgi:hypothetical protein
MAWAQGFFHLRIIVGRWSLNVDQLLTNNDLQTTINQQRFTINRQRFTPDEQN